MNFSKKLGRLSSVGPEILAFGGHFSEQFQLTFDCFIPKSKLKYEDSENIKTDCVDIVICYFQLTCTSNQTEKLFFGHLIVQKYF